MKTMTIFLCLIFMNSIIAQTELECGMDGTIPQVFPRGYVFNPPQVGGRYAPAKTLNGANMKILCIFAQFAEDNRDPLNSYWPKNSMPVWSNTFIGTDPAQAPFNPNTISNYFYEMSNGQNVIIGHVHPELIIIPGPISSDWGSKNNLVLQAVDASINFNDFDKWNMMEEYNQLPNQSDNYVDAVYIIWRNLQRDWGGYGTLNTNYITQEGKIVNSSSPTIGMTLNIGKNGNYNFVDHLGLMAHEYGHYLFGGAHNFEPIWASGGFRQRGAGLMPTGDGSLAMNPHEMYLLGYRSYSDIFYNQSDNITDYHSGGSAFRIPIPVLDSQGNPNLNPDEFFIIANHQKNNIYDKNKGKGILVYHVKSKNYSTNHMDIVCADGLWNWSVHSWVPRPQGIGGPVDWVMSNTTPSSHLPIITKSSVNRVSGRDELQELVYAYFQNGNYWWDRVINENGIVTDDYRGNQKDFFEKDYNQIFTPWSNPPAYNKNRNSTKSGFQIVSKNNGVYSDNFFADSVGCQNAPPSKPQFLKVSSSVNLHPYLTWTANVEHDMNFYLVQKYVTVEQGWYTISQTANTYYEDLTENYCPPGQHCMAGHNVSYRIIAVDNQFLSSVPSDIVTTNVLGNHPEKIALNPSSELPSDYSLTQNYPNPFNPSTLIHYSVKDAGLVSLKVFDILGRELAVLVNDNKEAGYHSVEFNASNLPSGIYIYTLQVNGYTNSKKMLLLK